MRAFPATKTTCIWNHICSGCRVLVESHFIIPTTFFIGKIRHFHLIFLPTALIPILQRLGILLRSGKFFPAITERTTFRMQAVKVLSQNYILFILKLMRSSCKETNLKGLKSLLLITASLRNSHHIVYDITSIPLLRCSLSACLSVCCSAIWKDYQSAYIAYVPSVWWWCFPRGLQEKMTRKIEWWSFCLDVHPDCLPYAFVSPESGKNLIWMRSDRDYCSHTSKRYSVSEGKDNWIFSAVGLSCCFVENLAKCAPRWSKIYRWWQTRT